VFVILKAREYFVVSVTDMAGGHEVAVVQVCLSERVSLALKQIQSQTGHKLGAMKLLSSDATLLLDPLETWCVYGLAHWDCPRSVMLIVDPTAQDVISSAIVFRAAFLSSLSLLLFLFSFLQLSPHFSHLAYLFISHVFVSPD